MSCNGPNFAFGIRRLFDAQQSFVRAGFPVYLRRRNFPVSQNQTWNQLGFRIAPTGGPGGVTNTPVVYSFFALGIGTHHYITMGANQYLYTETGGQSSAQLALALSTGGLTALGASIVNDPYVSLSVVSNQITLTPKGTSGAVVTLAASDGNAVATMWVTTNPTVTTAANKGTTDTQIKPQPSTNMVSVHNIGQSGGKLRFGARYFLISQTFVAAQVTARTLTDQNLVWRDPTVVGLVSENLLFSIEDISHEESSGQTISWMLTCNANELR